MKKKLRKKTKSDWRKHSDVKDVEDYLENCRRDERLGVPAVEKDDSELYFVQTETEIPLPVSSRRSEIRKKPLRSELNLAINSTVKGFPSCKRKAQKPRKEATLIHDQSLQSVDSSSDEEYSQSVSHRNIHCSRIKSILDRKDQFNNKCKPKNQKGSGDLWDDEIPSGKMNDEHYLKVTRQKEVKRPKSRSEVPSLLRNVELPHPGMSYNPSFKDHQDLLRMAVSVEEKKKKEAEKLQRKLQLSKMSHLERERVWAEEMKEGIGEERLGEEKGGEEQIEEEEEEECVGRRPIRAEDRKTKKQRRKELMRKNAELLRKIQKSRKIQMDEVYRIRTIKKEIKKGDAATAKKRMKLLNMKKKALFGTRRLGRLKYSEPAIPLKLSSQLTGNLRTLRREGSLAMDRYKSLQKRNLIEPRQLVQPHRKYKLLYKEKHSAL